MKKIKVLIVLISFLFIMLGCTDNKYGIFSTDMNPRYSSDGTNREACYIMEVMDEPLNSTGINWGWYDQSEPWLIGYSSSIYLGPHFYGKVTITDKNGVIEMVGETTEVTDQERTKESKLPIKGIYNSKTKCWKMTIYPKLKNMCRKGYPRELIT